MEKIDKIEGRVMPTAWLGVLVVASIGATAGTALLWFVDWQMEAAATWVLIGVLGFVAVIIPARWMVLSFVVFMVMSHQYKSPFTVEALGFEWHPRDLMLGALLLNGLIAAFRQPRNFPVELRWPSFALMLYGAFFLYGAAVGVLLGNDLTLIRGELRYPLYLLSFFPLLWAIRSRDDLLFVFKGVAWATAFIAVASMAFFAYVGWSGALVVNVQNSLGEFVRREVFGGLLQSVRPSGHTFLEVGLIVVASLLLGQQLKGRARTFAAMALLVLVCAIAITMMRTAYLSVLVGLTMLAWLYLPVRWRFLSAATATFAGIALLTALWLYMGAYVSAGDLEVSLRARFVETMGAWELFIANPLWGSGLGSLFRAPGLVAPHTLLSVREADYQTVHNAWMYFLYKGGLVGVAMVGIAVGILFWQAIRSADRLNSGLDQALLRGIIAAFTSQCVASLTMPRITYPEGTVMLALMAVIVAVYVQEASKMKVRPTGVVDERR